MGRRSVSVVAGAAVAAVILSGLAAVPWNASAAGSVEPAALGAHPMAMPADGVRTLSLHAGAGDWVIAYSWASGSYDASGSIALLGSPSDDASMAIATSSAGGILCWHAPAASTCYLRFSAASGGSVDSGVFVSHTAIALNVPRRLVVPYGSRPALSCVLTDPAYRYVAYDGPALAFENARLDASHDGHSWTPVWAGPTDVAGRVSRATALVSKRTEFSFNYDGAVYGSSAFAAVRSATIDVIPRFDLRMRRRGDVQAERTFYLYGSVAPTIPSGPTSVVVEARRRGSSKMLTFTMTAYQARGGASPLRASVSLPSAGAWSFRLHARTTSDNAETATKWVSVRAR
jgi:hypothetical protein